LTFVHLLKCIFDLEPRAVNMLQAPRYLNPTLIWVASCGPKSSWEYCDQRI